ncbi:MAG: glycosyltransferase [Planctomycetota bacterium]|nr:glycosyltransferase [Planctomycetota bacterium]
MTALTLCMIVRDEEAFLGGCLDSVAGLVDSIVVVDTGSSDATVAIAESRGAQVVRQDWNDDFSAARNAALAHVARSKRRFVLVLDADERLGPGAAAAIRAALKRDDFDIGMLPLHDATTLGATHEDVLSGRARRGEPVALPRLLRFDEDLRWEGRVHEQVTTWSRKPGRRIATIEAPIVHLGAVPELRAARGKAERNRLLLERRAQDEPSNPTVRAYLAREYDRCGDTRRALLEARASWLALVASAGSGRPASDVVLPVSVMAYFSVQHGDLDAAADALTRARLWSDPHPNIELLSGLVHERRALAAADVDAFAGELTAARADYGRCLALRGRQFAAEIMPGACGATGTTRLATVTLLLGEARAARELFESVLREDPRNVECVLGRCEAWIDEGSPANALAELEPLLAGGTADAWALSAAAALAFGERPTARLFAENARTAARTKPWIGGWRRGRLEELLGVLAEPAPQAAAPAVATAAPLRASVVIPCYNRFDLLEPVLAGFVREKQASGCQIVLVDDGSEPPLLDFVRSLGLESSVDLVRRTNGGRGAALNDGLSRATGDVVIFCDSDIAPAPGFVEDHVAFHREHRSELATHLGALEWGVDAGLFGALLGARANPRLRGGTRDVDWTQWFTDNWSFKRSLLASRGIAFDLAYRAWGFEELDLARELKALGATNRLTERAQGLHLKPATSEGLRACFVRSVPNLLYLARKAPDDADVRGWLAAHADEDSVARAERAYEHVWRRLCELDRDHGPVIRDASSGPTAALAIALSDATFHIGIARGLVQNRALAESHADLLPPTDASKLFGQVDQLASRLDAVERRLGGPPEHSAWLASVADELGWDEHRHTLRSRWASKPLAPA